MDNIKARFAQYQNAIEESNIVSKTDINGIITFVNDEFCKICGYSRKELIGKNHNIVRHPDVPKENFKQLWGTILSKNVYKGIAKNLTKYKKVVYLNTTIIPILDLNGEIEEFLAIRHDVTQVIELNEQLLKTQNELKTLNLGLEERVAEQTKELTQLNENLKSIVEAEIVKNEEKTRIMIIQSHFASMGEMIANISHQWRQPLNELSIALFKMKRLVQSSDNEFENLYNRCKNIIKNMSNTIEDFSGFFTINKPPQEFYLSDVVKNSIFMLQGALEKKGIKVSINVKKETYILGHKRYIEQVVINLINNAKDVLIERNIKNKRIKIDISSQDKFIIVDVNDNGGGIDKSIIDKIFEPYFTTKQTKQGTGIGLYMSKLIIDKFNGIIEVKNKKEGACFTIKLPKQGDMTDE
ncbi:PAS domain S-box protein [Campylobacter sp. faydin G-24]|uniref:histidine kinase n=1 Tax=Campylobacter anatolicus TaxID=2829105 RepID=A0ABS5HHI9_9BACT|nr:PAS domain-containing sensor histidine kinase [Campylobacter anatolicus]MBR8461740.1 PAS domain S-box protein [Campylobacter anatolicus]MBR8463475.1 PAS domain S-box protein [Campylobacter anatolicus]MBR8465172.1 PAS domain S-box protein [Campylobacter anatolicus]